MGRTSKRGLTNSSASIKQGCKIYRAGIYARLSSAQDMKKNESIESQIEIAKKFVEQFNSKNAGESIEVVECYTDLGKTGSNFERDGFQRLLQDIRLGDVNCVIVKDLSRFGRNYLEAGNYIEKIFPFLGVRFIAVTEALDTGGGKDANKQLSLEIKNLVNDIYAKDFSQKAQIHLKQRREAGNYVGGPPPYGYVSEWQGKKRVLIPDENVACIVKFIYEEFVRTENYTSVMNELNRRKINPPSVYKCTGEVYYSECEDSFKGWNKTAIERIINSETYSGKLVQGKTTITGRCEMNRTKKSKEEWVISNDSHEALIDIELYQKAIKVRDKIQERSAMHKHPTEGCPLEGNIFDNVLYCGVCGKKMTRNSQVKCYENGEKTRQDGYFCANSIRTKVGMCQESNRMSKTELVGILIPLIRVEYAVLLDKPKYLNYGKNRISEAYKAAEKELKDTQKKLRNIAEEESHVYMDYREGKILQKNYVTYKMAKVEERDCLIKKEEEQKKRIKSLEKLADKYLAAIKSILKFKTGKQLTKEMIETFISRIYIYPGKRVEVEFNFTVDSMEGL